MKGTRLDGNPTHWLCSLRGHRWNLFYTGEDEAPILALCVRCRYVEKWRIQL